MAPLNVFPARERADWRRSAEAALKGADPDALASETPDKFSIGPLHSAAEGTRALREAPGPWKVLCRLDHPDADDMAAQAREDLDAGADGLVLVFANAGASYGFGLRSADSASLARALDGIAFDAGARFDLEVADDSQALAFAGLVERSGALSANVDVSFGVDPLGQAARLGREPDLDAVFRASALRARGFSGPLVTADGRVVHDAGGTPAQELAFALACGTAYLRVLERPDAIAFRLTADADQFATLAKFRALRRLWSAVESACGLPSRPIRLSATSAWRMTTAVEPFVNVMRAALAAFSAGLGGADDVCLLPFTQAIGLPDAFARRLARNTQLVELREARLGFVADPAAGAGAFEAMTTILCEKAWALFQRYEAAGGLASALAKGLVQSDVHRSAEALRRDVARAKTPLTGVSAHPHLAADRNSTLPAEPSPPPAVGLGALRPFRVAEPFEGLRATAKTVYLAALGPVAAHTRRVNFAREFFEAGGFAAVGGGPADSPVAAAAAFLASRAEVACLCGTDEAYASEAPAYAAALKAAGAVYLAGRPGAREAGWREAGVDGFAYAGADIVATLTGLERDLASRRDAGLSSGRSP